jgi:hypothetical protein
MCTKQAGCLVKVTSDLMCFTFGETLCRLGLHERLSLHAQLQSLLGKTAAGCVLQLIIQSASVCQHMAVNILVVARGGPAAAAGAGAGAVAAAAAAIRLTWGGSSEVKSTLRPPPMSSTFTLLRPHCCSISFSSPQTAGGVDQ